MINLHNYHTPVISLTAAYRALEERLPINVKIKQRLDRAYEIINGYGYTVEALSSDKNAEYAVYKASTSLFTDESKCYNVTQQSCTCPDYETAQAGLCKHRLAVMLIGEMLYGGINQNGCESRKGEENE